MNQQWIMGYKNTQYGFPSPSRPPFQCAKDLEYSPDELTTTTMARFNAKKARRYPNDEPGGVYANSRRTPGAQPPLETEPLPDDISGLELKFGHSKRLPHRVREYRKCESDKQEIVWHGFFHVQQQRRIHLALRRYGAFRIRGECRGRQPCKIHHREYHDVNAIGTHSKLMSIIQRELVAAREKDLRLHLGKERYAYLLIRTPPRFSLSPQKIGSQRDRIQRVNENNMKFHVRVVQVANRRKIVIVQRVTFGWACGSPDDDIRRCCRVQADAKSNLRPGKKGRRQVNPLPQPTPSQVGNKMSEMS
ncbi:hypothetical protein C8R43DRAFT_940429 [Mycena crocata]|nr:hypothetical protein C8R43DRAFT_940429 [Mycena crocata]